MDLTDLSRLGMPAAAALIAQRDRKALDGFIEALIGLTDELDGDPDDEPEEDLGVDDPPASIGGNGDLAWTETGAGSQGWLRISGSDDDEDDDEDRCLAGDDGVYSGPVIGGGGIYRPGEEIGSEDDAEPNGDEGFGADGS